MRSRTWSSKRLDTSGGVGAALSGASRGFWRKQHSGFLSFLSVNLGGVFMFRVVVLAAFAASLCGCAARFTLIDRSDGKIYSGTTDSSTMGGAGDATIEIEGEKFRGPWIYQPTGGSFGFSNFSSNTTITGSGTSYSAAGGYSKSTMQGVGSTTGGGSSFAVSAVGNGMINARTDGGRFIRCVFTFHTMQNTGIGECLRNDGRIYDLTLKR